MYFVSPPLPIDKHPLYKDPKFSSSFAQTAFRYFSLVKRDNNCFYTSVVFSLLNVVKVMDDDEVGALIGRLSRFRNEVERFNGSTLAFDDFFETFLEEIRQEHKFVAVDGEVLDGDYTEIFESCATGEDQSYYNYMIALFKLLISTYLKMNSELFAPVVGNVDTYCKQNIDVFNVDAGDIEISAMSQILGYEIHVTYLEGGYIMKRGEGKRCINLLYTPAHFEPVFEKLN